MWDAEAGAGSGAGSGDDGTDDGTDHHDDDEDRGLPRVPARLLVPGGALVAISVALCLGYGAVAPEIDRAVAGLVDTSGYVQAVLGGSDALTSTTVGGAS